MTIKTARTLLIKPIDGMTLEELQRHKVRLLDAWMESKASYGFAQAVRDGFYKIVADPGASGYVPSDLWLTNQLNYRCDEVEAKEHEILFEK